MLKSNSCIPTNKINYLFYIQHVWIYSLLSRLLSDKTCTGLDCELHVMCLTRNMKCLPYASFFNFFFFFNFVFVLFLCRSVWTAHSSLSLRFSLTFINDILLFIFINKRSRKPRWQFRMENPKTRAILVKDTGNIGERHGQYWWKTRAILVKDTERSRTTNKTVKH